MKQKVRSFSATLIASVLLLFAGSFAYGQATVTSDHDDYSPLSTAVFTGSGFEANETVVLKVKNLNQPCNTVSADSSYFPWTVVADQNGDFVTSWTVCDCMGDSLRLKALGETSGYIAYAYFTDANLNQVTVGAASQTLTYGSGGTVTYTVSVRATGSGSGPGNVTLTTTGLSADIPPGNITWSSSSSNFVSPNIINFTGPTTIDVTMSVNVPATTNVPASATFTVTATAGSTTRSGNGALTINRKSVTGSITADNKVYDGNTSATILTRNLGGVLFGDAVSLTGGTATFADKNTGVKTVTATGLSVSGAKAGNYILNSSTATTTAEITVKPLTATFTIANKTYDGNTAATITNRQLSGLVSGEAGSVSLTGGVATFSDKNAGVNKPVTVTGASLTGSGAGNYNIGSTTPSSANITAKTVTISFTVNNKEYDGNTTAIINSAAVTGVLPADDVSAEFSGATASFNSPNAGTQTVTASGFGITEADGAGNYQVNAAALFTTSATITQKPVTVTFTVSDKIYDGGVTASITGRQLIGIVSADAGSPAKVSASGGTATFADKNVNPPGSPKTVTAINFNLAGQSKSNYTIVLNTATTTANITPRNLSVTAQSDNRVYNGTTSSVIAPQVEDLQSGDEIGTAPTQVYDTRNVGTGKILTASGLVINDGNSGNNYTISYVNNNTGVITARDISVIAQSDNRVYNGTTSSVIAPQVEDLQSGDEIGTAPTQEYDTRNIGTGKTLTASGLMINDGNSGNNYTISYVNNNTGVITARDISVIAQSDNRVYNGTTSSVIAPQVEDLQSGDEIGTAPTQAYDTRNVGTGKTLTASGLVINDGNSGNNYVINYVTNTTGVISKKEINVTAQHDERIYNGNTSSAIVPLVEELETGDVIETAPIQTFITKTVGTNKTLTPAGLVINDGNGGLNYLANYVTDGTGIITAKGITGNITANNKVYDGNNNATLATRTLTGVIGTDAVTYSGGTAIFDDIPPGTGKNVGTNKPVTATGLSLSGEDAINYTVNTTATTTANITTAGLTVTAYNCTAQYSDPVTFGVSYAGFASGEGPGDLGGSLTYTTSTAVTTGYNPMIATGAPGVYTITPGGHTSNNYAITFKTGNLTITKEDAMVTYTGLTLVATTTAAATTATLTLSATIQDITALLADPAYDANQGDIRKATVTFNVDGVDKATVPIGLVNGSDVKTGTAVCNVTGVGIGDHIVYVKLNGHYCGVATGDNSFVIAVFQNNGDYITGGGYLKLVSSNGQKPGDAATKNNFGFNIKYNKGGTNLQGTINTIIRRMEAGILRIYQIKGTSMTSLTVNSTATPATALFNGKANITDITNPASPVTIGGNYTLQVSISDLGEPGTNDKIAITVFNKEGGTWYTSNWDGSKTIQQTLASGNVVVHGGNVGSASTARTETVTQTEAVPTMMSNQFIVKVYGNPATDHFNVNIQGSTGKTGIRVIDLKGRVVEYRENVPEGTLLLGQSYQPGFYYLEVRQGNSIKRIKLVKQ